MANSFFTVTPASGNTGSAEITVSATTINDSGYIKDGLFGVHTSVSTDDYKVDVVQYFKPILNQFAGKTIPASGGTIYFDVKSDYSYVFRSVPTWLTITDMSGSTINEGQVIVWSSANNYTKTYALTAGENTGTTRTVGATFNMAIYNHYGNLLTRYPYYFDVTQYGAVADKRISISPILLNVASGDTAATVSIVEENTTLDHFTISSAGTFTINATRSGSTMQLTFPINHDPQERRGYLSFYLYDADGGAWTSTITVVQAAGEGETPSISVSPAALTFDYNSSQSKTFTITTNSTVSVTNGNQSRFSISQNGNTVTVTTTNYNYGTSDNTGTITVSDTAGVAPSASVSLTQKYRPRFNTDTYDTIPASGGTITFTIDSEYTTRLKDIPAYVTITDTQGNTYTDGLEMTSAWTAGRSFIMTFSQNSGLSRGGDLHLETNLNGTWSVVDNIDFVQADGTSSSYIYIDPSTVMLDYPASRSAYLTVVTSGVSSMTPSITDSTNFSVEPATVYNSVGVHTETVNQTNNYRTMTLTLTDNDDPNNIGTATIGQKYRPYFDSQSSYVVPATGGTITFVVHTDYNIDFYNIPSYVTVKDYQNNTITNGQVITQSAANGKTFTLEFAANTLSSQRVVSDTFCMRNYMSGTVLDYKQFFSFSQDGTAVGEYVDFGVEFTNITTGNTIRVTIALNSDTYSYDTLTYVEDGTQDELTTGEFDCLAAEGDDITITLHVDYVTNPNEPVIVHINYNEGAEGNIDTIYQGETITLVTQYVPGASISFTVEN